MGVLDTTYTFTATDVVTSAKLNNVIDQTTFTASAITGTTLALLSGQLKVNSLGIGANELANNSVTAGKILDGSVTAPKLNGGQTGSAPIFGVRAYGAFNGQASTPITPINAGNIASITRTSTGNYTIVMTIPMEDSNYCVVANEFHNINNTYATSCSTTVVSNSSFTFQTGSNQFGEFNPTRIDFVVLK